MRMQEIVQIDDVRVGRRLVGDIGDEKIQLTDLGFEERLSVGVGDRDPKKAK